MKLLLRSGASRCMSGASFLVIVDRMLTPPVFPAGRNGRV
jgi:hypothetical protein